MANILVKDLYVPGFDLLSGEESYLNEINDSEFDLTHGGSSPICVVGVALGTGYAASYAVRRIHDVNWGIISPL